MASAATPFSCIDFSTVTLESRGWQPWPKVGRGRETVLPFAKRVEGSEGMWLLTEILTQPWQHKLLFFSLTAHDNGYPSQALWPNTNPDSIFSTVCLRGIIQRQKKRWKKNDLSFFIFFIFLNPWSLTSASLPKERSLDRRWKLTQARRCLLNEAPDVTLGRKKKISCSQNIDRA